MSNQRIPSLKLLMGFEAAARLGNFSRAADELYLSQSAISHQIQDLQEQIGQHLFRRVGRGVELTVAGAVLQRSVQRALETLRNGMEGMTTYLNPGLVVIVCPAPLLHGWLQPRLDMLQAAIPNLLPLLSTDESARYIDEDNVDITIGERPIREEGLLETPFLQDEWVLVARSDLASKLIGIEISQHHQHATLVCLEQSLTSDDTAVYFREHLGAFRKKAIYDDGRLLLGAVLRGKVVAFLPRLLAEEYIALGNLVILPNYPRLPGKTWWLSRVAGQPRSDLIVQVYDWLISQQNYAVSQGEE
jgi:LysR family transcriptional regulator, glycine cleavage system transcriptional activator